MQWFCEVVSVHLFLYSFQLTGVYGTNFNFCADFWINKYILLPVSCCAQKYCTHAWLGIAASIPFTTSSSAMAERPRELDQRFQMGGPFEARINTNSIKSVFIENIWYPMKISDTSNIYHWYISAIYIKPTLLWTGAGTGMSFPCCPLSQPRCTYQSLASILRPCHAM